MPNVVFSDRKDDDTGSIYGVFNHEFFHYTFTAGQNPNGIEDSVDQILAGTDPAELPHAELARFPLSDLTEIRAYQGWTHFDVRHRDSAGKAREVTVYDRSGAPLQRARELVAVIGRNHRESDPHTSIFGLLTFPSVTLLIVGIILGLVYMAANDMEQGKPVPIRGGGKSALLKAIVSGIASVLGTQGCLIVGGIALVLILAWIAKNILSWPRDLLFEFR